MTTHAAVHPYPAMLANELARELAAELVPRGATMLDPFCGTGRTMMACADAGAFAVGVDVNPLAVLVSRAKGERISGSTVKKLTEALTGPSRGPATPRALTVGARVEWFSPSVTKELSSIIDVVNSLAIPYSELVVVATILSATVREVSYCRKDQWKLHRLSSESRAAHTADATAVMLRRLLNFQREQSRQAPPGKTVAVQGDSRRLGSVLEEAGLPPRYDAVISSPPYGDSRTTVQYGGMSGVCLGVIQHLQGLGLAQEPGSRIDARGLGGGAVQRTSRPESGYEKYWPGDFDSLIGRRLSLFLDDLLMELREIGQLVRSGGTAALVVGNRNVGGETLRLDTVVVDGMTVNGFSLQASRSRRISNKVTPVSVSVRRGRGSAEASAVTTMRHEQILVFERQ